MSYFIKRVQTWFNGLGAEEKAKVTTSLSKEDVTYVNAAKGRVKKNKWGSNPESFVPINTIILARVCDVDSPRDRQIMAYYHPWQAANIKKVTEHLCMEEPKFIVPGTEGDEEPEIDEKVLSEWRRLRLQECWSKFVEKSRIHGWGFVDPIKESDLFKGYSGPPWYVRSADEAKPMKYKLGHPVLWQIKPSNNEVEPYERSIEQVIFNDPNNTDDFEGLPEGVDIWDELLDYVLIWEAVKSFDQRMGNGFMVIGVPQRTKDSEITNIENNLKHVRTQVGLVIRMDVDEPVQVNWQQMSGAQVDFMNHLEKLEDMFAMSMGFPKRFLKGDQEGAMESSGKDALQVNIKLKALFKKYIPFIKALLKYYKLIEKDEDIIIQPAFEMQLSEQEKIALNQIKTQTIAAKSWLTVDEKRELDGYDPMTDEQKAEQMKENQFNIGFGDEKPQQPKDEEDKETTPKKEKTDVYDTLLDIFTSNEISINQLADLTGRSPTTINRIREKFDNERKLRYKEDSIFVKEDAAIIPITPNMVRVEGVKLVLPQKKYYERYRRNCIRTPEAIKKAFSDPKTPKEFRIGVTQNDDHKTRIPREIPLENAIGRTILKEIDEEGAIIGDIEYDLSAADKILGENNWIREKFSRGEIPNTSIALESRDRLIGEDLVENDLDIRSFVATRHPRNKKAGT